MKKIIVNCERNDPIDIRCGGPINLGFDFYVNDDEADETVQFIKEKLRENNLPLMDIMVVNSVDVLPWNKEQIAECIKGGY